MFLINIISEVELFFVDLIKEILIAYPQKLSSHSVLLSDALELDREQLILNASEIYLNKIMCKKPSEYLSLIGDILSIDISDISTPTELVRTIHRLSEVDRQAVANRG